MKSRLLIYHPDARTDLKRAWSLVKRNDGEPRADGVLARMEGFCEALGEFAEIGTRHDERRRGMRSVGVPGLKTATVLFLVLPEAVIVLRVGYLGMNIWNTLPDPANDNARDDGRAGPACQHALAPRCI